MIMRKGVAPDGGELLRTFGPKRSFALYKIKTTSKWLTLKLILAAGSAVKANYSIYWDGERMAGNDFPILSTHEPKIAQEVADYVKETFSELPAAEVTSSQRTSEGVPPENTDPIGEILDIDGVDWDVYPTAATGGTNLGVKLVAKERLVGRANYQLEWNGERFIRDANFQRLTERLGLLDAAEGFMEQLELPAHDSDWPNKPDALTAMSLHIKQDEGYLTFKGGLYEALKRDNPEVWATVEELLKQYFLEKSFN